MVRHFAIQIQTFGYHVNFHNPKQVIPDFILKIIILVWYLKNLFARVLAYIFRKIGYLLQISKYNKYKNLA